MTSPEERRLNLLRQAFAARRTDPLIAADLLAQAGPGPELERARLEAWLETLRQGGAGAARWRGFLAGRPPADLEAPAVLALAAAQSAEGDAADAVATLLGAPEAIRHEADLALLDLGSPEVVAGAAARLARDAPERLRRHSRELERLVLATFDHDDWFARAGAWRAAGLGSRGVDELRRLRFDGDDERHRRLELARCELDAGSPGRALNGLPAPASSDPDELVLRAEAERRRAWQQVPDGGAARAFNRCLEPAERAAAVGGADRRQALVLILECGTEAGRLDEAMAAWRRLAADDWTDDRRSWLGRRLGVALARAGSRPDAVAELAASLPDQERCLRYWLASETGDRTTLAGLATPVPADLYGRWAASESGADRGLEPWRPEDAIAPAAPPRSVAWLLANASDVEAWNEWQRLLARRRPSRAEALAAAELASRSGRVNTSIRTLLSAFPSLGSPGMADAPANAVAAYLPLRWPEQVVAAARETGLDPWLIAGVARQESVFEAHARSPADARGVLQLLPGTARLHARALGIGPRPDLFDPAVNIRLGAHELAALVGRFGALEPALAAYNAGERRARLWWRSWPDRRVFAESIPIPETANYVRRVVYLSEAYRVAHADAWRGAP